MIYMSRSNNPSSGDKNSSNLSCIMSAIFQNTFSMEYKQQTSKADIFWTKKILEG